MDLVLNNLQKLICHKTQPTKSKTVLSKLTLSNSDSYIKKIKLQLLNPELIYLSPQFIAEYTSKLLLTTFLLHLSIHIERKADRQNGYKLNTIDKLERKLYDLSILILTSILKTFKILIKKKPKKKKKKKTTTNNETTFGVNVYEIPRKKNATQTSATNEYINTRY